jgi:hypothetical protein
VELVLRDTDESAVALVHPTTAEVIDLDTATREQIAEWYLALLGWEESAARATRLANAAFVERSDKETTLGVNIGGFRVSVPGAEDRFVPDAETLRAALLALVEDGSITKEAADQACRPAGVECPHCKGFVATGGFKVSAKALTALRKVKRLATIIDACGEYHSPSRGFQVKKR